MLFHSDDQNDIIHANALKLFDSNDDDSYKIIIKNPLQFELVIDYLIIDLSFR